MLIFSAITVPDKPCNRLQINGTWYERDVILSNVGRPYHLVVQKSTNMLFFSYSLSEIYADVDFQLAYFNLDTKEHEVIAGIRGGCSVAVDDTNDDIYLGGSDGIYTYNMFTKLADFYKEKGKNIWTLFFKTNLFYISYPDQRLHIEVDGKFVRVSEFEQFEVDNFYMASNNDIHFSNKTGFYKLDYGVGYIESVSDFLSVRQIVEDNEGVLYLCTTYGLYVRVDEEFIQILNLKNMFGLAFDKDNNIIYSDDHSIIQLRKSDGDCIDTTKVGW